MLARNSPSTTFSTLLEATAEGRGRGRDADQLRGPGGESRCSGRRSSTRAWAKGTGSACSSRSLRLALDARRLTHRRRLRQRHPLFKAPRSVPHADGDIRVMIVDTASGGFSANRQTAFYHARLLRSAASPRKRKEALWVDAQGGLGLEVTSGLRTRRFYWVAKVLDRQRNVVGGPRSSPRPDNDHRTASLGAALTRRRDDQHNVSATGDALRPFQRPEIFEGLRRTRSRRYGRAARLSLLPVRKPCARTRAPPRVTCQHRRRIPQPTETQAMLDQRNQDLLLRA